MKSYQQYILVLLCLCCQMFTHAQTFTDDCILIDFETIPEGTLQEGLNIFDQYSERYGITFNLENGGTPVLAEIGSPRTAFQSNWGPDIPAPGVDIGSFFLTDDGILSSNLENVPLIITFETPMDSVSGCILDMDFGEEFIIQAFGKTGDMIFEKFVQAGDPGTGDGLCTPWGFRLDDCEGSLYSVRLDGKREQSGGFGLGIDNLAFCKFGATINVDFVIEQKDIICGAESGEINVTSISDELMEYSFQGGPFESEVVAQDLPVGEYNIVVRNEFGCEEEFNISIDEFAEPEIMSITATDTQCGLENGILSLEVENGVAPIEYTIDGQNYNTEGIFTDLEPGSYTVFIVDALGCVDFASEVIEPSLGPEIVGVEHMDASCDLTNGTVTLLATTPFPSIEYNINGQGWQSDPNFDELDPGNYQITMKDAMGCTLDTAVTIGMYPLIELREVAETQPDCLVDNGTISVSYIGGVGEVEYSIDGGTYQSESTFEGLASGSYTVTIRDSLGCELDVEALVPPYICPVYVGNIFGPNGNGFNEIFPVITADEYQPGILRYSIYDRWGELVYDAENFSIHDRSYYWDGTFNGTPAVTGVYVYLIEVAHIDGSIEYLSGDVTLIR